MVQLKTPLSTFSPLEGDLNKPQGSNGTQSSSVLTSVQTAPQTTSVQTANTATQTSGPTSTGYYGKNLMERMRANNFWSKPKEEAGSVQSDAVPAATPSVDVEQKKLDAEYKARQSVLDSQMADLRKDYLARIDKGREDLQNVYDYLGVSEGKEKKFKKDNESKKKLFLLGEAIRQIGNLAAVHGGASPQKLESVIPEIEKRYQTDKALRVQRGKDKLSQAQERLKQESDAAYKEYLAGIDEAQLKQKALSQERNYNLAVRKANDAKEDKKDNLDLKGREQTRKEKKDAVTAAQNDAKIEIARGRENRLATGDGSSAASKKLNNRFNELYSKYPDLVRRYAENNNLNVDNNKKKDRFGRPSTGRSGSWSDVKHKKGVVDYIEYVISGGKASRGSRQGNTPAKGNNGRKTSAKRVQSSGRKLSIFS